ncbi:lytic murein transglycosylase [Desulfoferrobacter suflitae]|uniref:lytic murein transglycosylase n=1 Tax=Desulfoferrobacter suflitae TaxID=2865782 RepID=UPI002164542E|nr:lytic murein transglycosylase [Desulfoferrobacter suflitae]MCK8601731.1 lytic murein transglycosylase [Desulfoferrobacter suflitae]
MTAFKLTPGDAGLGLRCRVLTLVVTASLALGCCSSGYGAQGFFRPLQQKLVQDGFAPDFVMRVYQANPSPLFETVASTLRIRESKLNYKQFLQPAAMAKARQFMRTYGPILSDAERAYGVDKCVIVAILSVETRFGSYTGFTPTLNILSTFAVMDRKSYRDIVWNLLSAKDQKRWGREAFDKKLVQRSKWAYGELHALLTWADGEPSRIRSFKGSLMGAIGWPQFLPSSLVQHGADGNGDGYVDLFDPRDAIVSVASYLSAHGWKDYGDRAQKEKVIYAYNHSQPYVDTILGIAGRLQQDAG